MINQNLQTLREKNKLTQEQVAEKINVSRQAVAKWENGKSLPDIFNCTKLAALYNVSLDTLVNIEPTYGLPLPPKGRHVFGTVIVGERGQIVLPKKARDKFHIQSGCTLIVLGDENQGGLALMDANLFLSGFEHIKESIIADKADENDEEEQG